MRGDVHAHQFLFFLELRQFVFLARHRRHFRPHGLHFLHLPEEGRSGIDGIVVVAIGIIDQLVDEGDVVLARQEELGAAGAERIERSRVDQRFEGFPIHARDAFRKIEDVCKRTVGLAFGDDGIHHIGAESFHAAQAETDVSVLVHGKAGFRFVHVGAQHLDAALLAVVHDFLQLRHVGQLVAQVGRLEFGRIMRFQPAGLVGYPGIAGGVRFVEGVRGELPPVGPDLVQHLLGMAVFYAALDKIGIQALQHVDFFLSHGLAELVGLAFGEARHLLGNPHHLLLVHGYAVGFLQEFAHDRQVEGDLFLAPFAGDEGGDVIHRPRTVEGVHSDEVLEALRVQALQPLLHAGRFKLEDAFGIAPRIEVVCGGIVNGNCLNINVYPVPFLDLRQALHDDGQGPQAQEVHLQHAHFFDVGTFVLRYPHLLPGGLVGAGGDGDVVGQVAAADDHRTGVDACLADAALQFHGIFQHFVDERVVAFVFGLQFRDVFDAILQVRLHFLFFAVHLDGERAVRNELGEPVGIVQRQPANPRDILDGELGRHGAEGNDVRDVVHPVLFLHVLDHAVAAFIVKIHVDIRHRDAFGVQETLEQEVVPDGVQVGDAQAVRDGAAGRAATSRAHGNAVVFRPVDEILDNQEVIRETHAGDGLQLKVDALFLDVVQFLTVPHVRSLVAEFAQVGYGVAEVVSAVGAALFGAVFVVHHLVPALVDDRLVQAGPVVDVFEEVGRQFETGQYVSAVDVVVFHLLQHFQRVGDGFRVIREEGEHLFFALEILLLGIVQAVRLVQELAGIQADKPVVGGTVFLIDKVDVVGGNHLHAVLFGQLEQGGHVGALALVNVQGQARHLGFVVHYLQVIVLSEEFLVPFDGLVRPGDIARQDAARNFARHAGRTADEVFVVFLYNLVAHPRLVVVFSFDVAGGDNLHQVLVAVVVLGQQDQVIVFAVLGVFDAVVVALRHINLTADDGFDGGMFFGKFKKLLHPVHVAVVGDGEAGHAHLLGAVEQMLDGTLPIED